MRPEIEQQPGSLLVSSESRPKSSDRRDIQVSLLTGGTDKDYAFGLAGALIEEGVFLDFIGSDEVNGLALQNSRQVNSLNLRGSQKRSAKTLEKTLRIFLYYVRLIRYAALSKPKIFHILWHNKFLLLDRTALMLFYKILGKRIAFTAHNVNAGKRDLNDSFLNRLSLKSQYRLADCIFVHTQRMKSEMMEEFSVPDRKITVIPYGLYNTLPNTKITGRQAKKSLGLDEDLRILLFFGNLAPYKGLEYLVEALAQASKGDAKLRLIIAGPTNQCTDYWAQIQEAIKRHNLREKVIEHIGFVPDERVELYFKAADVCVLPYTHIFQSGVIFLGYSFGLPVIATDVGSLREEIIEGKTGFICQPRDPVDLAKSIATYFSSELSRDLENRRPSIKAWAEEGHAWSKVGAITSKAYAALMKD
jgi:glycosyltransferase involved in cell wall biosynthesis